MPTVFRLNGFRYFFFSNEGFEPVHIHIEKGEKYAKFWLYPLSVAYNDGFNSSELNKIEKVVMRHKNLIEEKWNEYFNLG